VAKHRVKFTFPADLVTRPIIYYLGHQFELVTNVRRADVRENEGRVVLELEGTEEEIDKGVGWVSPLGVRVDPVTGDVVES